MPSTVTTRHNQFHTISAELLFMAKTFNFNNSNNPMPYEFSASMFASPFLPLQCFKPFLKIKCQEIDSLHSPLLPTHVVHHIFNILVIPLLAPCQPYKSTCA